MPKIIKIKQKEQDGVKDNDRRREKTIKGRY